MTATKKIKTSPAKNQSLLETDNVAASRSSIPQIIRKTARAPSLIPSPPGEITATIPIVAAKGKLAAVRNGNDRGINPSAKK